MRFLLGRGGFSLAVSGLEAHRLGANLLWAKKISRRGFLSTVGFVRRGFSPDGGGSAARFGWLGWLQKRRFRARWSGG